MGNIIIFGGSFDPIHNGHLKIALEAHEQIGGKVVFVPSKYPRWKEPTAKAEHRLKMLKIAIKPYSSFFQIDDLEINSNKNPNYTIDTIKNYKERYPEDNLYLLIGEDQVNKFHDWKNSEEISSLAKIIYYGRNESSHIHVEKNVQKYHMEHLEGELSNTSSTDIREMRSVDLPLYVLAYILEHDLYFAKVVRKYYSYERYKHVCSSAMTACLMAMMNENVHIDFYQAFVASYLHDLGKEVRSSVQEEIMETKFYEFKDMPQYCWHQFVGRQLAKDDFCIDNEDILNAIEYHCTGRANMSLLEKVVYCADKTEPTREYPTQEMLNACNRDIEEGFLFVLNENKKHIESKKNKGAINRLSEECFKYYLK